MKRVLAEIPGYELREKVLRLKKHADADQYPVVISHNDFLSEFLD